MCLRDLAVMWFEIGNEKMLRVCQWQCSENEGKEESWDVMGGGF
jgi:hypothetical protein